jgi:hypothetical protein
MRIKPIGLMVLSLVLVAIILPYALTPWLRHRMALSWEWQWGVMVIPVALASVILRYDRREAWVALLLAGVGFGLRYRGLGVRWYGGLPSVKWILESATGNIFPSLGLIFFIGVLVVIAALAAKASDDEALWPVAIARGFVALMASLALWYPLDYFVPVSLHLPARILPAARTAMALLPAVIFALLIWRRGRGVVLWIGVIMASVVFAAVAVFEAERISMADIGLITLAMLPGPAWVYFDWQRSRSVIRARGFEVVLPVQG